MNWEIGLQLSDEGHLSLLVDHGSVVEEDVPIAAGVGAEAVDVGVGGQAAHPEGLPAPVFEES